MKSIEAAGGPNEIDFTEDVPFTCPNAPRDVPRTTNRTSLTETTGSADGASINKVRPRLTHPSILPKRVLSLFSRSAMVNGHAL